MGKPTDLSLQANMINVLQLQQLEHVYHGAMLKRPMEAGSFDVWNVRNRLGPLCRRLDVSGVNMLRAGWSAEV